VVAAGVSKGGRRIDNPPQVKKPAPQALVFRSSDLSSMLQAAASIFGYRKILISLRFFLISDM
jgi:hypothetical protein